MKTVTFSLNELINDMDESIVEEAYFNNYVSRSVSKRRVQQNVFNEIRASRKVSKIRYKTTFVIIAILLFSCISVYAALDSLSSSTLIDDSNRSLIGTEIHDSSYIICKDGVYNNEKGEEINIDKLEKPGNGFPESRIVKSSKITNFIPSSIVEFPTEESTGIFISPEIILVNNSLCILTKDSGNGWELSENDMITYSFEKYGSDLIDNQTLIVGYIKDGVMYEGEAFDDLVGEYNFSPSESGKYYLYLLSASSDYLSLKKGGLEIN